MGKNQPQKASKLARDVVDIIKDNGWVFHRRGSGDHDIWKNPKTNQKVCVDTGMKSRHTANGVLDQCGLPKTL